MKKINEKGMDSKAEIDTGNTIEYDFTSYQVKQTIVKEHKYN